MKVSDAILVGVGASMSSKYAGQPQASAAPYPPTQHFAQLGRLGFNTSSNKSTISTGSIAVPLLPRPTSSSDLGSMTSPPSSSLPGSAVRPTSLASAAPTRKCSCRRKHAVSAPSSPPSVRPSIIGPSHNSLCQHASHPAPSNLYPLPHPAPTESAIPSETLSRLPKAPPPSYSTTAALTTSTSTSTQHHAISHNCGNRTTVAGTRTETSYSVVPVMETTTATSSSWPEASRSGRVTSPTALLTAPCAFATDGASSDVQPISSSGGSNSGSIASANPTPGSGAAPSPSRILSEGFMQATATHLLDDVQNSSAPDTMQNSGAPNTMQRSLVWMAAALMLAAVWPC